MRSAGSYKGRVYHIGPWREVDRSSAHLFHTTYIPILAHRHLAYFFFVWLLPFFLQCIPAVWYSYLTSIGLKRRTLTWFWLSYMLFVPNVLLKVLMHIIMMPFVLFHTFFHISDWAECFWGTSRSHTKGALVYFQLLFLQNWMLRLSRNAMGLKSAKNFTENVKLM